MPQNTGILLVIFFLVVNVKNVERTHDKLKYHKSWLSYLRLKRSFARVLGQNNDFKLANDNRRDAQHLGRIGRRVEEERWRAWTNEGIRGQNREWSVEHNSSFLSIKSLTITCSLQWLLKDISMLIRVDIGTVNSIKSLKSWLTSYLLKRWPK